MKLIIEILPYLAIINGIGIVITVYDKFAARIGLWRISENFLLFVAAIGGSIFMYIIMQIIRHKTRHKKFVYGLPIIAITQIILMMFFILYIQ
jgi:uncharacterized membrane protein YsdA (DUF1294 family)